MSNIIYNHQDLEHFQILDLSRGLFIEIMIESSHVAVILNKIYAYSYMNSSEEPVIALEQAMIWSLFSTFQASNLLETQIIENIKIDYKQYDKYILDSETNCEEVTRKLLVYLSQLM